MRSSMSGVILRILNKQRFEYSYLAPGATQDIILQPAINVGMFYRAQMIVRVHERSFLGAGQLMRLFAFNTVPSCEDPREFTDETSPFLQVDVTSLAPIGVPGIVSATASDPGASLKVVLRASQGTASSSTLYAELSAVLVLREH
jgi:hypothetical protein